MQVLIIKDDFAEALASALPDGVDVYFENVGGAISDEVFKHLNRFARIPVCGLYHLIIIQKGILVHVFKEH